jgi:hypothetical protein
MKYTANIKQATTIGGVLVKPGTGDLSEKEVKNVMSDRWGQELIEKGFLKIDMNAPKKASAKAAP